MDYIVLNGMRPLTYFAEYIIGIVCEYFSRKDVKISFLWGPNMTFMQNYYLQQLWCKFQRNFLLPLFCT